MKRKKKRMKLQELEIIRKIVITIKNKSMKNMAKKKMKMNKKTMKMNMTMKMNITKKTIKMSLYAFNAASKLNKHLC